MISVSEGFQMLTYLTGNIKTYKWFHINLKLKDWGGKHSALFHFTKALVASALFKGFIHFLLTGTEQSNGGFLRQQEVRQNMQFLILLIAKSPKQDNMVMNHI